MANKHAGIELDDDMDFQRRDWRAQRVGWIAMLLLVVAAAAGFLGNGPMSRASAKSGHAELRYERFVRVHAPAEWRVAAQPQGAGALRVEIDSSLLREIQIASIVPAPARVESAPGHAAYVFGGAGASPAEVTFHFKVQSAGRLEGTVRAGDAALRVAAWALP